ncbi:hypothetical protein [Burkholderia contaminans]|uniref:hypothetical protein n=1 Tax=Burkholderia contaminans TaxID=488447 RepID=UPI002D7E7811|nr:hypothetical protein [Burkholderia contaminans]
MLLAIDADANKPGFRAIRADTQEQSAPIREEIQLPGRLRGFDLSKETLINEPVVRITDEAGCNFQIDVGI